MFGNTGQHTKEDTMPRPSTKEDLLKAAKENYETLMAFIAGMTEKDLRKMKSHLK